MHNKPLSFISFMSKLIFNKYVWLIFIPIVIGLLMLAERLDMRTYKAMYAQKNSVERIWGGNLAQPMPSVRYKHFGSDVSSLSRGDIHATDVKVALNVDYRKKGLVYYTGYNAEFMGKYTLKNPEKEKIYLSFIFPYPTEQGEGMLSDVKLLVNGEEDLQNTEYQPTLALWTGLLEAGASLEITLHYKGRGLNAFKYGFESGKQINNFNLQMLVDVSDNLDYPDSTMPPTAPLEVSEQGTKLVWQLDRTLTRFNIGVVLPDKLNIEKQMAVMSYRAPAFFLLFFLALLITFVLAGQAVNFIQVAVVSVGYFMFYPLFAYLVVYIHPVLALLTAFAVIGFLIFNYLRNLHQTQIALAVLVAYTFCLGITTVAALLPLYTGLILTLEGVVLIAVIMQVLTQFKHLQVNELFDWVEANPTKTPSKTDVETDVVAGDK